MIQLGNKNIQSISLGKGSISYAQIGDKPIFGTIKAEENPTDSEYEKGSILPRDAQACDIVLVNYSTKKKVIVRDVDGDKYPQYAYSPLGIVVIPGSHGVLKDGSGTRNQCGIISMSEMSTDWPTLGDYGSDMYFGNINYLVKNKADGLGRYDSIDNGLTAFNCIACNTAPSNTSTGLTKVTYSYMPLQNTPGSLPEYDGSVSFYNEYIPSPYSNSDLMSGDYNPNYGTSEFNTETRFNALSDFNGIINTKIYIDSEQYQPDWKTDRTIQDRDDRWHFTAALCCASHKALGKAFKDCSIEELRDGNGFWYLPSIGELAYVLPRLADINKVFDRVNEVYFVGRKLMTDKVYWSSTQAEGTQAYVIRLSSGRVEPEYNRSCPVRAFMRLG